MFLGDVAPDRQAAITALTLDVMAFYAERFGTLASAFTLYIVNDEEARVARMEEVLGETPPLQCGLTEGNVAFVRLRCAEDAIAHEYFQVLQGVWAPAALLPASDTGWERGAWWLIEGSGNYAKLRYLESVHRTDSSYQRRLTNADRRLLSFDPTPLRDLEAYVPWIPFIPEALATLAVDWLAEQTSDDAVADYFRLLPVSPDWRAALPRIHRSKLDGAGCRAGGEFGGCGGARRAVPGADRSEEPSLSAARGR